jgi:AraC-like DNA-binding protein/mannose-6-phosphate isomerase-like protein (cupin superfamily)
VRKKSDSIPVNTFSDESDAGVTIEEISFDKLPDLGDWEQPERHDRHSFFLLKNGSVTMEIDFQRHEIFSPSIIYMHPDQVHRIIAFENVRVCALGINNEHLNPDYRNLLEATKPAAPLRLDENAFSLISEAGSLCIKLSRRKKDKLYYSLFKDSCNILVGLVISHFTDQTKPGDQLSRFDVVTKAFRSALEHHFMSLKSPARYAQSLNISAPYLNECVKNVTGHPVSYHIQQRVILEAKRLLYHSGKSVKEIAATLGYDDYPYFSRLFTKLVGLSPVAFRNKNHE